MRLPGLLALLLLVPAAWAAIDAYEFDDPGDERRYRALIEELRCPKCQNQNIAGSNAPLAADLRQKVYDMLQAGESDGAIVDYMVQRYGDFVTYRPPLKPVTWPLWFGPLAAVVLVGLGLAFWIRRRAREAPPEELSAGERERLQALLRERSEPR
jgi:cytochrome c-type biogenesis protein CcmH